jgi:hypothetical protein
LLFIALSPEIAPKAEPTSQAQSALASQDRSALLIAPAREEAHHAPAFGAIPDDGF